MFGSMISYPQKYDLIVVGAGHAGCEAALAAARMGCQALLLTMNAETIAQMSCNPAIGGLAKGHLVREIDALGGEMASVIDATGIQFRMLNTSKGPAVWALRAQADRVGYRLEMRRRLERQPGLDVKQANVMEVLVKKGKAVGVATNTGICFQGRAVVLATGTFLNGLIHIGLVNFPAGRAGEFPALGLSDSLRRLGFKLGRLTTCTPPRIDGQTIDFDKLEAQHGDEPPQPFSHRTEELVVNQLPCYITYTNEKTHQLIRDGLGTSSLLSGRAEGMGPRYCPSIEDKVVRFADKERHQIFLEPEGRSTDEFYVNGFFTGLPEDIQLKALRTLPGLEEVEIVRPGYAIEYDFVPPTQILLSLETKLVENLFFAGQINGTSGYEEAAAQGIMAGINGALKIRGKEPLMLDRSEAYIGVLIDDLVTKGTKEPYRMFTSRAEYRLILRQDNADLRLMEYGHRLGLIPDRLFAKLTEKKRLIEAELNRLERTFVKPEPANQVLRGLSSKGISQPQPLAQLLRRPEVRYSDLSSVDPGNGRLPAEVARQVEIEVKYKGYIDRQLAQVERFKKLEQRRIPEDFDFSSLRGLSTEAKEKLQAIRPRSIGQASRISGASPADISILMIHLEKYRRGRQG